MAHLPKQVHKDLGLAVWSEGLFIQRSQVSPDQKTGELLGDWFYREVDQCEHEGPRHLSGETMENLQETCLLS